MPSAQKLDTHHKALTLNLDASAFGSFAEIGAGQEVAHWFFLEVSRPHYELGSVGADRCCEILFPPELHLAIGGKL